MNLTIGIITVNHKGVADVALITTIVNGPVTHVINGAAIVNLVVHHVIPSLLVVGVIGLLNILDIGIVVKESDDTAEHIPEKSVTALARIDGMEGNTDFIHQLSHLGSVLVLTITSPHFAIIVLIVIELCSSGHLLAIQHISISVRTETVGRILQTLHDCGKSNRNATSIAATIAGQCMA